MTCTSLVIIAATVGLAAGSLITLAIGIIANIVENRWRGPLVEPGPDTETTS